MNIKKTPLFLLVALAFSLSACGSSDGDGNITAPNKTNSSAEETDPSSSGSQTPGSSATTATIDYSRGRLMNARIGKGINMGNTFDATCEACWGAGPVELEQVQAIAAAGFNSIRLPVRWDDEALMGAPYTITPAYLARVKEVVGWINGAGLIAIINMHHHQSFLNSTNAANEEAHLIRVAEIWRQVATYFADVSADSLIFELFNEPRDGVSADAHNKMIEQTFPIIRSISPDRTVMFGSNDYNAYTGIRRLKLPADGNIIFTPHYYLPANYALQGENYQCPDVITTWDGTKAEKEAMENDFDKMIELANQYYPGGLPINIGEFGATECGGIPSRVKWVTNFVKLAKERGISWNYWGFTNVGGYEIYDKDVTETWSDTETLNALLK
ncbi:MAG: glycoside hydrolase family 5 protein [Fibrobacter sp.]|nr:glycoside hydrolase family 5 protein [Fibrobacter sp.]